MKSTEKTAVVLFNFGGPDSPEDVEPFLHNFTERSTDIGQNPETHLNTLFAILAPYYPRLSALHRIECIDISITGTSLATGSLVVMSDGIPDPGQYRRFFIRGVETSDMYRMREVVMRRLKHREWTYPDLLVLDGGKPQLSVVSEYLRSQAIDIPVIGIAKRYDDLVVLTKNGFTTIALPQGNAGVSIIQVLRDEAHRFAKAYHTKLRTKECLTRG